MVTDQLYLVRHGETEWSAAGKHTGRTDLPLTESGRNSARSLSERLAGISFAKVITSPSLRARQTAELAGFAEPEPVEGLYEWDYGQYEGITTQQIRQTVADWTIWTHPVPGGETSAEVATRVDRVVELARAADGPVLAFGHGHSGRALAARWLGLSVEYGRFWALSTATISTLGDDRGVPVIHRWNS